MPRKYSNAENNPNSATSSSAAGPKRSTGPSEKAQSQSKVEPEKDDSKSSVWSGPKRSFTMTDAPPPNEQKAEPPKMRSAKPGEGTRSPWPDPDPVCEFIKDVNPDLTLAIRVEDALGMESDLDNEMERELIAEGVEPWIARMMRQAWSTEPMQSLDYEDFAKYRIDAEAFKAMKTEDPLEIMAFAQATALQSTIFFKLREVGRQKMSPEVEERRYRSIARLSDSYTKLVTALQHSRRKGAQTVRVQYEHRDHGRVGQTRTHKLTLNRTGSEIGLATNTKAKEPVTIDAPTNGKPAETAVGAEAPKAKPTKPQRAQEAGRGRK